MKNNIELVEKIKTGDKRLEDFLKNNLLKSLEGININDKENFNKIQQEIINSSNLDIQNEIIDKKDVNNLTNKGEINLKTQESLLSNTILKQFPNNKSFSQQNKRQKEPYKEFPDS